MIVKKMFCMFILIFAVVLYLPTFAFAVDEFNTAVPPVGYSPAIPGVNNVNVKAMVAPLVSGADILLIQSAIPWNSTADTYVLNRLGYTYEIADMSDIPNMNLNNYQVILIVNDQVQSFYNYYAQNYSFFDNYVRNGGILVFFACDRGWANGNNYTNLPGNVQVGDRYNPYNLISDYSHPIITQELIDHQLLFGYPSLPLSNADLYGNYVSHNYFIETTLPVSNIVILRTNDSSQDPTLVVYPLGKGYVIASGITWEAGYSWWNRIIPNMWSYGRSLPDVFKYAFSLAGGFKPSGVNISIYPEDNWTTNGRPTIYKHPKDLLDIVAVITNTTGQEQSGVTLKLEVEPASAFNTNEFVPIFKRSSAEEIAIKDYEEITTNVQKSLDGNKWVITVSGLTIPTETQQKWNDFVFRFKLSSSTSNINATASVYGDNIATSMKRLSDYAKTPVSIINNGKIFLTNRQGMYRNFARNANNTLNGDYASQVNQLWETMNKIAEEQRGVIYYVDKYDQYDPNPSDNPTLNWWDYRKKNLPNDYDSDTDSNNEEGKINKVSNLVDSMLKTFIDNSGGVGSGRYVAIIGDDAIIPFYRIFDPTKTVLDNWEYHDISKITKKDAKNNYLFTDIIYRDYDGKGWGNGDVENIFVGRIIGMYPQDLAKFLESSNNQSTNSNNVVKLENYEFDGELSDYEKVSQKFGYTVVKNIDNVSLDFYPDCGCRWWDLKCKDNCKDPDPALWDPSFENLFTGNAGNIKTFDIFRADTHGNTIGIYSSYSQTTFFDTFDISSSKQLISENFKKISPFFIYDGCLLGLTDIDADDPIISFLNIWAPLNTKGILASTGISWTANMIKGSSVELDDIFYQEFLSSNAGSALNRAEKDYGSIYCGSMCDYAKFEVNLFGVPWAKVTPPKSRNANIAKVAMAAGVVESSQVLQNAINSLSQNLLIDASGYSIETTKDGYDLVVIDGFKLFMQNSQIPVVPIQTYNVDLPLDATVDKVEVVLSGQQELGQLNIPAFVPASPMSDPNVLPAHYVSSPTDIGTFPQNLYSYKVATHDNKVRVIVTVIPVSFNSATGQTDLYQSININVQYSTPSKGIVTDFSVSKDTYAIGENIETYTTVKNTSPDTTNYLAIIEVRDYLDNIVTTASGSASINSDSSDIIQVNIPTPFNPGNYKVVGTVSDGQNQIGSSEQMIKVVNAQIEYFNVPEKIITNNYGTFEVGIKNLANTLATALVDFYIYKGQHQVAKLPQLSAVNIGLNETRNVQTQWFPPDALEYGSYLVQAVVMINENVISTSMEKTEIIGSNQPPIAAAGPDQTVERTSTSGASVTFNGSGSSDPDGDTLTYNWTWSGGSANGVNPTIILPVGLTTITLTVSDGELSSIDTVDINVVDTTAPLVNIIIPDLNDAVQDGVTLTAGASDISGVTDVSFYVREPNGANGVPIGYEGLAGTFNGATGKWEYNFDTTKLQDGYYVIIAKATDTYGNEGWSAVVPFSIRNWAVIKLLPASENNKAGRTMPVKFALRIVPSVDPKTPFVYNEDLAIKIYKSSNLGNILQTSLFGVNSTDYRIISTSELYITNFKTLTTPAEYTVEIWRINKNWKVGSFTFKTVK